MNTKGEERTLNAIDNVRTWRTASMETIVMVIQTLLKFSSYLSQKVESRSPVENSRHLRSPNDNDCKRTLCLLAAAYVLS